MHVPKVIQNRFDPEKLSASAGTIPNEDPRLLQNHGEKLYRIVFQWKELKLKGGLSLLITTKNK